VTHGKHKTPGELAVAWSQTGPAGKNGTNGTNGINGKDGTNGINGTNGTNGATNVTAREGSVESIPNGSVGVVSASCNPGEKATGGGSSKSGEPWSVEESFPTPASGTPTGWRVFAKNNTGGTANLVAVVVCASP
jgi:hypothetical protein